MKALIIGDFTSYVSAIELSYERAFQELEWEAYRFPINQAVNRYIRFGKLGKKFSQFVPIEAWLRKANRELTVQAIDTKPDIVIVVGNYPVQTGALAQIQASTRAKLVFIWPDTLQNLSANTLTSIPMYDLIATYSIASEHSFRKLGGKKVVWIPLAGDTLLYPRQVLQNQPLTDISFIGGWRPERERILTKLSQQFSLKIWGPDWGRRCKHNKVIQKSWQEQPLYGKTFAQAVAKSKINLNIIDPTNYPAANMRFFEIPVAGGLQISSPCPEMAEEFRHGEEILYYRHEDELFHLIQVALSNDTMRQKIAEAAYAKVITKHTYMHRATAILEHSNFK